MKKLALLSLVFLSLFACRNDIDETLAVEETQNDPTITIIDYTPDMIPVTATLFGTVTDENGAPVGGAAVTLESNTETTDDNGRFVFKNLEMNAAGTFVQVNSNGYFPGSYRFFPQEGSVNYTQITLLTKSNTGSFVSSEGGVISSPLGFEVAFPANSIVTSNGNTYDGTVEVSARFIDPTSENLQTLMPGGLQGIDENAEEVALASFGMMAVELESSTGLSLNLGNNLKATLSITVPDELLANAPAEIPLWYFNDNYGLWVQEGSATLEGDKYIGEVAHFSFWNYDAPAPYINLSGTVVSQAGVPIPNAYVYLTIVSSGMSAGGWTNNYGVFSGKVPDNEEFIMTISQSNMACAVYTDNIGPFTVDTNLGTIVIEQADMLDVTGTVVDCNGNAVTNGWITLALGTQSFTYYVTDGTISASFFNCDNETELSVIAGDLDELEMSDVLIYTVVNPINLGAVAACGIVLPEYFIVEIDGVTTTFANPYLNINLGPDSTSISSGSIPQTDFSFNITMDEITGTGTYGNDDVGFSNFFLPGNNSFHWMNCYNGSGQNECGFDEINITQFGNIGDDVIGTFSGAAEVFDSIQGTILLPYTGSFKIIRE